MFKSLFQCQTFSRCYPIKFLSSITSLPSLNHIDSSSVRHLSNYGWQIEKYFIDQEFERNQVQYNEKMRLPIIYNPNDLLVEVKAASVNPIDLVMIRGYGREIIDNLNVLAQVTKCKMSYDKFPLVLGRDFSGVIRNVGGNITKFKVGDEVWGSVSPFKQGSHCKYVVASQNELSLKPTNLSFQDAASIPYVALTSWSTLFKFGNFSIQNAPFKRILILGGSGGLGTFTVQLLKAFDCEVSVTCSSDAKEFMSQLVDSDHIYDYRNLTQLFMEKESHFDYILDYASSPTVEDEIKLLKLLKRNSNSYYLTTRSPLMKNADQNGLLVGLLKSLKSAGELTINSFQMSTRARWTFYEANQAALECIKKLCENNQIKPVVQRCFDFQELPFAYEAVHKSHLRGKVVIKF